MMKEYCMVPRENYLGNIYSINIADRISVSGGFVPC